MMSKISYLNKILLIIAKAPPTFGGALYLETILKVFYQLA